MQDQDQELPQEQPGFVEGRLPWVIAGVALVVYLITLNHWVSVASLPRVAKVTGWDWWTLDLQAPLFLILTWPIRWFPPNLQPLVLNAFAALCAAGTLGLLARSVALLPHDRTRDQRQREGSDYSFLTIRAAWVPPVLACLAAGLQLTFWEHATVATGEMLNLLLFAYVVRCLLEYRLDEKDSWLCRSALVYGLAITNNYAMIGFLPAYLVALLWIRGARFFDWRWLGRMALLGLLGLTLYLVLPTVELMQAKSNLSFWQLFKAQLGQQKYILGIFPRYVVVLCALSSLLPVVFLGIRWPSSMGDVSIIGAFLTQFLMRIMHLVFLGTCLWVMFDPPFSPRILGLGLPFLPLYFLSALGLGYYSGYFLLLGTPEREHHRHRQVTLNTLTHRLLMGLVLVAVVAIPAGLLYRNLPKIREASAHHLKLLATQMLRSLPENQPALILSDEPMTLLLFEAGAATLGQRFKYVPVDTRAMASRYYVRNLHRRYPQVWPDYMAQLNLDEPLDPITQVRLIATLARSNAVFYLHPSASLFAEGVFRRPQGMVYRMLPYQPDQIFPPPLTNEEVNAASNFWRQLQPWLQGWAPRAKQPEADTLITDLRFVGNYYARALNTWAVDLQQLGQWEAAIPWLELAAKINPDNIAALINADYNRQRRQQPLSEKKSGATLEELLKRAHGWSGLLRENGPLDEPVNGMKIGEELARTTATMPASLRQATQIFQRILDLNPEQVAARIWLGSIYLKGRRPEETLRIITETRAQQGKYPLSLAQRSELYRLEAWAMIAQTNQTRAEEILQEARKQMPSDPTIPETLFQICLNAQQYTNALKAVEQQLEIDPLNPRALLNKGALCIQLKDYTNAIPPLDRLLEREPENEAALLNRAIALLRAERLDAAAQDYQALLKRSPNLYVAFYGLGEIADQQKDKAKAIYHYERFLKYAPKETLEIQKVEERLKALRAGA